LYARDSLHNSSKGLSKPVVNPGFPRFSAVLVGRGPWIGGVVQGVVARRDAAGGVSDMLTKWSRLVFGASMLAAVLCLGGCVTGPGYSDLDRERTSKDVLPADLPGYADDGMVAGTLRAVGERNGIRYFVANGKTTAACVLAYRSANDWWEGCGGSKLVLTHESALTMLVADGVHPGGEGWHPVSTNVFVRD
jgi:hypothetical protein